MDSLFAADVCDAFLASQSIQDDADLLLSRELAASLAFDLPNNGFRRSFRLFFGTHAFLLALDYHK